MKSIHNSAWLLAAASGLLQILVFPRPNLYWLCWIALTPLLYALLRTRRPDEQDICPDDIDAKLVPARPRQAFLLGWLSGTIFYLGTCYWVFSVMHLYGGLPTAVSAVLLVLFALYIGLHHALFALLISCAARSHRAAFSRRALVLAPFFWVTVELLRAYLVSFPWCLLGTAQIDNLPLARLASVTGVYGLSFEIALVNTVFAAALLSPRQYRGRMLIASLAAALALQSTIFVQVPAIDPDAHATLVQQNVPIVRQWSYEQYQQLIDALALISKAPSKPRDPSLSPLIIWPESPAPFETTDPLFVSTTAHLARSRHAFLLAGAAAIAPPASPSASEQIFNSAALIAPNGRPAGRYDKVHLVPWGEYVPFSWAFGFAQALTHEVGDFVPGSPERRPLDVGGHRMGVFICYETVFPHEVRQFVAHGAEFLVTISNDGWYGESGAAWQHLAMARMRAVENHRWLLRSTNTGITAAIDPLGRVVAASPRNQRLVLDAPYGVQSDVTIYTRYGDWFPLLCAIISITGLLWRDRTDARMTHPLPV